MNIKGKKILLRAIEFEDIKFLHQWANDPEIQYAVGGWHFPTNLEDQKKWFQNLNCNSLHQRFIIEAENMDVIGMVNLVDIDWKNKNAHHGMLLGDKNIRGKGFAQDAVMTIMRYCFEELGLERLDGSIIEYNVASYKLYVDKCGWINEGVKKNWYFRKNKFWDKFILGITKDDYQALINKNNYWAE